MKSIRITRVEFREFRELQVRLRWDWPATFSTNPSGDIWPYIRKGYTPVIDRKDVRGYSLPLDQIADIYLTVRDKGGRFFIDDDGAFWREGSNRLEQFVRWNFEGK